MSLVLEALRRVERPDGQAGIVGVAVPSYRPSARRRTTLWPLAFGLGAGGVLVLLFGPAPRSVVPPEGPRTSPPPGADSTARTARGGAGLPPPLIIEPSSLEASAQAAGVDTDRPGRTPDSTSVEPRRETLRPRALVTPSTPAFVLQAISERDGQPIAIINDQLVRAGDRLAGMRVMKIGTEAVEILLDSGAKDLVRFAPPPPEPSPAASPDGR